MPFLLGCLVPILWVESKTFFFDFLGIRSISCGFDSDRANQVCIIWHQSTESKIKVISYFYFFVESFYFCAPHFSLFVVL